jgi:hypothetical protein
LDFWFENLPSGNPAFYPAERQTPGEEIFTDFSNSKLAIKGRRQKSTPNGDADFLRTVFVLTVFS